MSCALINRTAGTNFRHQYLSYQSSECLGSHHKTIEDVQSTWDRTSFLRSINFRPLSAGVTDGRTDGQTDIIKGSVGPNKIWHPFKEELKYRNFD